ncbi:MAG TPA: M56 family metallopeptidase, partial [Lacipirellulaceae bacterium]|nr:M56 family metallopeptidase [Lacipirellulaceae bacterium]
MESISHAIADYLVQQSCQLTGLFVLVLFLSWALRNSSAHWRYLLWLVVVTKCIVPPVFNLSFAVLPPNAESKTNRHTAYAATAAGNAATQALPNALSPVASTEPARPAPFIATPLPSASNSADSTHITLRAWLMTLWLATVIVTLASIGTKAWKTHRRLRQARMPADHDTCALVAALAKRLGMRRIPTIYLANSVAQPFVWGWGRGSIYMPQHFVNGVSVEQRDAILTHELAHVSRWDAAANNIQLFAQAIFFFHPLVWWANKKIRQEREKCCDEIVLADTKTSTRLYCEAIVEMLTMEFEARHASPGLAVTGSTKNIEDRIVSILTPGRSFRRRPTRAAIVTTILVAAFVLPTALVLTTHAEPAATVAPNSDASNTTTPTATASNKNAWAPGQVIDVRVINAQTKEPIPGVTLELQNMGPGINFGDVKKSTTDADGHSLVKLCDLPPTAVRIYPSKPGFVPLRVYWEGQPSPAMPKSITIPLEPGKAFGGTVRNEAGEPIPDVLVSIDYWATGSGKNPHIRDNINHKTKTDKDGHWQVDIMPATIETKELHIYLTHPNYISDHLKRGFGPIPITEQPPLEKLFDRTAEMVMKKGETLSGRVTAS